MSRSFVLLLTVAALALAAARADDEGESAQSSARAIPDSELSLDPGSVFGTRAPRGFAWNATDPGENERLPRANPLAPPRVPHGIADFVPITRSANACLDCHALGAGAGAPELPPSHRTDLRRTPESAGDAVAGARWVCVSCHLPTSDARPLRDNSAAAQGLRHRITAP